MELAGILVTHHHFDHTGGIEQLCEHRGIPVYGGANSSVPTITIKLTESDTLRLDGNLDFQIIDVPGHTLDHIAFYTPEHGALFCGDTLFVAGCGRMFEGTASQMRQSLNKLASLPPETKVYCAHEYTESNLAFALAVEPDNKEIQNKVESVTNLRASGLPTVPGTIGEELNTNPFLRSASETVRSQALARESAHALNEDEVFASIRSWKDNF